jgi:heme exporter protein C
MRFGRNLVISYWLATAAAFAGAIALLALWTPREQTMGIIQKIFYLHMPAAAGLLACAAVVFIAGVGHLWTRRMAFDDLGAAAAGVAVLLGAIVLITGSIWGHAAWWQATGQWWMFTPRLTFSLILYLMYLVYGAIRPLVDSAQRRAVVCAVFGILAFLDVPLVWLSARLIRDPLHPPSIGMTGPIKLTLLFWFVPMGLMIAGLVVGAYRLNRLRTIRGVEQAAARAAASAAARRAPDRQPAGETR